MLRTAFASILVLALVCTRSTQAQSLEFKKINSLLGLFSVEMPGSPVVSSPDLISHRFTVVPSESTKFFVGYFDLEAEVLARKSPQAILKDFRGGYREGIDFETSKEIVFGAKFLPGLEHRFVLGEDVFVRERIFLSGNRIYTLFVLAIDDKRFRDSDAANRFFDSFTVQGN